VGTRTEFTKNWRFLNQETDADAALTTALKWSTETQHVQDVQDAIDMSNWFCSWGGYWLLCVLVADSKLGIAWWDQ